jgi:hypothetical protein
VGPTVPPVQWYWGSFQGVKRPRRGNGHQIRDRKQRTDIGKYSFVNRTNQNGNQLIAEALGTFPVNPKFYKGLGEQF